MPKILVWKCPNTGKLFEDDAVYKTHLRKLAKERAQDRKEDVLRSNLEDTFKVMRDTCQSGDDIAKFILQNWESFHVNGIKKWDRDWSLQSKKPRKNKKPFAKVIDCKVVIGNYCNLSNSHDCPFNGVTNWERKDDKPKYYPGWSARLNLTFDSEYTGFGSNFFENTGLTISCGGGGFQNLSYTATLFEDDWEGLRKQKLINDIKG